MARRASSTPTEAELEILQVLWEQGPGSVRQVNQTLNLTRTTGYTTTLKLMQIMLAKGLLRRDERQRPQVYAPAASKDRTQRQLVRDLLERVFEGSASQFVLQVLSTKKASPAELAEIRRLLQGWGKEKK
jgi:BlaI family penicillinase repressor